MSIDSRLREGLDRAMSAIGTEVDQHFEEAARAGRRRAMLRRVAVATAMAAILAMIAIATPTILDLMDGQQPRPATTPAALPMTGSYVVQVTEQDAAGAGVSGAEGRWLLVLSGDGQLRLSSLTAGDVGSSVTQYSITGDAILTTALDSECSGVGRYIWSRAGSTLTFTLEDDPCAIRVAILSSHPWHTA